MVKLLRSILPNALAFLTGKPRYLPTLEWSGTSVTHNLFRAYEWLFWRKEGIRAETSYYQDSKGNSYHWAHTFEGAAALTEAWIRARAPKPFKVVFPQMATTTGFPMAPSPFLFAIAFDAAAGVQVNTSSTLAATTSGSDRLGIGFVLGDIAGDNLSSLTYNAVGMTNAVKLQYPTDRWAYMYYLPAPATGTNNMVQTGLTYRELGFINYTGCSQTGQPDSTNSSFNAGSTTTCTITTTVVAANCWIVGYVYGSGNYVSGTGTKRGTSGSTCMIDSNGTVGTGSQSKTVTADNNPFLQLCISIKEPGAAGPANWKTYNTVTVATNLKTINTNTLANTKTYDTIS